MGDQWRSIILGEIGRWYGGSTPSKARVDFWTNGDIPWVSPKDMKSLRIADSEDHITAIALQERNQSLVPAGAVLVVIRSGILSRTLPVATTVQSVTINQDLKALEPFDGIDSEFTAWFLRSAERRILEECAKDGTTVASVNLDALKSVSMPLPPTVEQRAIVAKIEALFSELDQGVAQLQTVRRQLGRYRQSVLKAAFEGRLTAEWRERQRQEAARTGQPRPTAQDLLTRIRAEREAAYQQRRTEWQQALADWEAAGGKQSDQKKPRQPTRPTDPPPLTPEELAELPELPEGWVWHRLALATLGVEYGSAKKSRPEGEVPVIRMGNMQNGVIDWEDLVFTSDQEEIEQYRLSPNDVLFNRTNSPELVGKTVIYRGERPAIFAGYLVRVNQITSIALAQFATYFLNSHLAKQHGNRVKTDGVNQSNINGTKLAAYPFPYCDPDEQTEIVNEIDARLSVVDQVEHIIATALRQAESLRQSILKKAFEGRLLSEPELAAVRADPGYEPADQLLKRIKGGASAPPTRRKAVPTAKVSGADRYTQAACAAYAVKRLGSLPTFGRVQQMKFLYLAPHIVEKELRIHAERQAAGPYDPAIHKIESLGNKQGWFHTRDQGERTSYKAGWKIDEACAVAEKFFGPGKAKVDWLLEKFSKFDTERAELVATTFAVWNDFLIDGKEPSEQEIVAGVHGWHPTKADKFSADRVVSCFKWLREHDLVPTGTGARTVEASP